MELVCFHIGNAILAYYDLVNGDQYEHLHGRLALLEEIALLGVSAFVSQGNDAEGYMLMTPAALQAQLLLKRQTEEK